MEAKLLNPIIESLGETMSMFMGVEPTRKETDLLNGSVPDNTDTHVFAGITGNLDGTMLLSADQKEALSLAGLMTGMETETFDDITVSALKELGNMVLGGAATRYSQLGLEAEITPPTFMQGDNLTVKLHYPLISLKFAVNDLDFYINLSVKEAKGKDVLIVDDSDFMRKNLTDILVQEDYKVIGECNNGEQCLEYLGNGRQPEIVLMDITMPGMDGLKTLKKIKTDYPYIKVVMITAIGREEVMQKAFSLGADGYLMKPPSKEQLKNILKKI